MTNLGKKDLEEMISEKDTTPLVLHWEGDNSEPERGDAASILQSIVETIDDEHTEADLWKIAYICTEQDYQEEQEEQR